MKKFFSLALSLLLILTTVVFPVSAEDGLTVASFDATANMLVINFSADVTGATGSISLTKDGAALSSTTKVEGTQAIVVPAEDFAEGYAYGFEIPAGFGNATTTTEKINKFFKITEVFADNFDGYDTTKAPSTYLGTNYAHTYSNSAFYPIFSSVNAGRLLLNNGSGGDTFYIKSAAVAALADYSLSFNYKTYGADATTSKLVVGLNTKDTTTKLNYSTNPTPAMYCETTAAQVTAKPSNANSYLNHNSATVTVTNGLAGTYTQGNFNTYCVPTDVSGTNFEYSFVKKGKTITTYINGQKVSSQTYSDTVSTTDKGYIGFMPIANLSSLDDLAVTTCVEIEDPNKPIIATLTAINGTPDVVELTFDNDLTGCTNAAEKIAVYDENDVKLDNVTYIVNGATINVYSESGFELDKTYVIRIESGLGTAKTYTDTVYLKGFKNTKIFFDNFDGYTLTETTAKQDYLATNYYNSYATTNYYPQFLRVADGRLLLRNTNGTTYLKSTAVAALDNYSVSYNYKTYNNNNSDSKFVVAFNAADAATMLNNSANPAPAMYCETTATQVTAKPANATSLLNHNSETVAVTNGIAGTFTHGNFWTADVPTEVSGTDYEYSFIKKGRTVTTYINGQKVSSQNYANTVSVNTNGYIGFIPVAGLSSLDDLAVTTFDEVVDVEDPTVAKTAALTGIDGTLDMVILTFDMDMSACTNADEKIKIYDGAKAMDITYKFSDKTIIAYSEEGFEPDKKYTLFIESGLGSTRVLTDTAYVKEFKNTSVFFDNFDGYTVPDQETSGGVKSDYLSTNYYNSSATTNYYPQFLRIDDGRLLLRNANGTTYLKSTAVAELDNYSVSYNYKTYSSSDSKFVVAFNAADATTMLNYSTNPAPAMYCTTTATQVTAKPANATYLLNHNSETVAVTNGIAGTYTGDTYWTADVPTEVSGTDYEYSFIKKGRTVTTYINGQKVSSQTYANTVSVNTNGYIGFIPVAGLSSLDDLAVTTFAANDPSTFNLCGFYIEDQNGNEITTAAQLAAATAITGKARVENYSGASKELTLVAAVYGNNNIMLAAQVLYDDTVGNGQYIEEPISFSVSNATKVKVFAFDSFGNLTPYSEAGQVPAVQ